MCWAGTVPREVLVQPQHVVKQSRGCLKQGLREQARANLQRPRQKSHHVIICAEVHAGCLVVDGGAAASCSLQPVFLQICYCFA